VVRQRNIERDVVPDRLEVYQRSVSVSTGTTSSTYARPEAGAVAAEQDGWMTSRIIEAALSAPRPGARQIPTAP
jgi:hypothetical protein